MFFATHVVVSLTKERWQELSSELSSFLQNEEGGLPGIGDLKVSDAIARGCKNVGTEYAANAISHKILQILK